MKHPYQKNFDKGVSTQKSETKINNYVNGGSLYFFKKQGTFIIL